MTKTNPNPHKAAQQPAPKPAVPNPDQIPGGDGQKTTADIATNTADGTRSQEQVEESKRVAEADAEAKRKADAEREANERGERERREREERERVERGKREQEEAEAKRKADAEAEAARKAAKAPAPWPEGERPQPRVKHRR